MFQHMLPHGKAQATGAAKAGGGGARKAAPTPRHALGSQAPLPAGGGAKAGGGWAAPLLSKDGEEYYAEDDEDGCWDRTCGACFAWTLAPDVVGHVSAQKVGGRGVWMWMCLQPYHVRPLETHPPDSTAQPPTPPNSPSPITLQPRRWSPSSSSPTSAPSSTGSTWPSPSPPSAPPCWPSPPTTPSPRYAGLIKALSFGCVGNKSMGTCG